MPRFHLINGELIQYTAEEESARDAEEASDIAKEDSIKYINERREGTSTTPGYGSFGEQLDKLYHDINAGKFGADAKTREWFVGISSVKTAFPKP